MVKAVIFDCFGVLVKSSLIPFGETYFASDTEKQQKLFELDRQANMGQLDYGSFVTQIAELAGISEQEAEEAMDDTPANAPLLDYIQSALKPNYKIGFLSNASDNWLDDLFTTEQQALFDGVVLSYQHGIAKPDPEIYKLAARKLGVKPEACVFVDDIMSYCEGAEAVGMRAILYRFRNLQTAVRGYAMSTYRLNTLVFYKIVTDTEHKAK